MCKDCLRQIDSTSTAVLIKTKGMMRLTLLLLVFLALSSTKATAESNTFLDLHIRLSLEKIPKSCNSSCLIPYTLHLLKRDMSALRTQDGVLPAQLPGFFEQRTVFDVPDELIGRQLYLGLNFHGLPRGSQNYFVVGISKPMRRRRDKPVRLSVQAENVRLKVKITRGTITTDDSSRRRQTAFACKCKKLECSCCEHLEVPRLHLNDTGCANISYIPADKGIRISFSIDKFVVFSEELSARNPPPICFAIPYGHYASACVRFYKLTLTKQQFSGCVRFEAHLYHFTIANIRLGCFHIPLISGRHDQDS